MADLRISQLPPLAGGLLQATDVLAVADLSASETKKITAKDLVQAAVALVDAGSIPSDKVNITLPAGSVGTTQLANKSVTAPKLADNSSVVVNTALPVAGDYIGQLGVVTPSNKASVWTGGAWQPLGTGIVTLTGGVAGVLTTDVTQLGDTASVVAGLSATTGPKQFLAGPTTSGGAITHRTIDSADLPLATGATAGVVSVSTSGGLAINGGASGLEANIEIDNNVTPGVSYGVVTYNAKGLVTGGRVLTSADLPIATNTTIGGIASGLEFSVAPGGSLHHVNQIAAGTGTKVSYDAQGHITGAVVLDATDIPDLPASKITTGVLNADRIADRSVTADKLGDYALAFIQEAVPTAGVGSHPIGMTWLQESTGQVSVWNGNSWMKTGASTLFNRNLRYCGTFDATNATITGVTQFGTAEGFKVGDAIPAADDKQAGVYFVCAVAGSNASLAGGVVFDAGDWVLNQGTSGGWVRIDTLSGSGGGSSVTHLNDLLDVTLTSPAKDQMLVYTAAGQWVNKPAPGGASTTAPTSPTTGQLWTDTSKSPPVVNVWDGANWVVASGGGVEASATAPTGPTTGQLWTDTSKSTPVLNVWDGTKWVPIGSTEASETVKGIVELATAAEVLAGTDVVRAVTPKGLKDHYIAKNIALLPALP